MIEPTHTRKALIAYLDPQQAPQRRSAGQRLSSSSIQKAALPGMGVQLMSDRSQPAARRREGIMYESLCFIMHIPQTSMTNLLASSLHWLPGGGSRWPSTLHELSAFHQVTAEPTASSRHLTLGGRQPRARMPRHPHFQIQCRARKCPPHLQRRCGKHSHSMSMCKVEAW